MLGIYLYIECMNSLQILQLPVTQSLALYITSLCPGGPGNRFQMLKSLVLIFQLPSYKIYSLQLRKTIELITCKLVLKLQSIVPGYPLFKKL